jgi:hypothetical protein
MFHADSMAIQSSHKTRRVILLLAFAVFCTLSVVPEAVGQVAPIATRTPENTPPRRNSRPRPPRKDPGTVSKTPASEASYNFVTLGDRFRDLKKWNAAEAAYKEAVLVWSGNGDALLALGYIYLDEKNPDAAKKLENARGVHSKLRSVDSSLAATLLDEINRFQTQVAH